MFKAIILLSKKEGVSADDFKAWWLGQHAALVRELPGIRRAVFNTLEAADYDGVSELWFDSQSDFESAYQTDRGKAVAADTLGMNKARIRMMAQEHIIVGSADV